MSPKIAYQKFSLSLLTCRHRIATNAHRLAELRAIAIGQPNIAQKNN